MQFEIHTRPVQSAGGGGVIGAIRPHLERREFFLLLFIHFLVCFWFLLEELHPVSEARTPFFFGGGGALVSRGAPALGSENLFVSLFEFFFFFCFSHPTSEKLHTGLVIHYLEFHISLQIWFKLFFGTALGPKIVRPKILKQFVSTKIPHSTYYTIKSEVGTQT